MCQKGLEYGEIKKRGYTIAKIAIVSILLHVFAIVYLGGLIYFL
jgi:hypothetical protein